MKDRFIFSTMIMLTLLVSFLIPCIASARATDEDPVIGAADANIAGTVVNGTVGMVVHIFSTMTPESGPPVILYFNTTTDGTGSFNQTVDSNDTTMSPYQIDVDATYYKDVVVRTHIFFERAVSGQTQHVPPGGLEAVDAPIGNLSVRILNGSSGQPLGGVVVTVDHVGPLPDIPFPRAQLTHPGGEVYYTDIRSVETEIEAEKLHFLDLSDTVVENSIIIQEGGDTIVYFNLTEDPWPFTTTPSNGAKSANITNGVLVDFGQEMDLASIIKKDNYRFSDGSVPIDFTIVVPDPSNEYVRLVPDSSLDYDSGYEVSLYATLNSFGGGLPLWRTMDINFTTESPPGMVSGRIVDDVAGDPAPGVKVKLVDQIIVTSPDGNFTFPLVIPGIHVLDVLDGYLFDGTQVTDVSVDRGGSVELGDIEVSARSMGSLNVTITSRGTPLEGAWVKILSSILADDEFNMTTDTEGIASFERVRSGNVNLRIGAPHHGSRIDAVIVPESGLGTLSLDLVEDDLPVVIELTEEISSGVADVGSDFLITLPEPVLFQSLSVSLWKLNATGGRVEEIALAPPQEGVIENSYVVRVQGLLPYATSFEFEIDSDLETLDDGEFLLWRNMVLFFVTVVVPDAHLNGTLLLEGNPLEGVIIEFDGQMGTTDDEGGFNVTIELLSLSKEGKIIVNLTDRGYQLFLMDVTVTGGKTIEVGMIDLVPLEDWYGVSPADGVEHVDPDTDITFSFIVPLVEPEGGWSDVFKVIREGTSAPVTGTFILGEGNLSILFDPANGLMENNIYNVVVTEELLQENGLPFFPVSNTTQFKVRPKMIIIEIISPLDLSTDKQDLDQSITLSFGLSVNRSLIEAAVDVSPLVDPVVFNWISSSDVAISAFYAASTSYTLTILPGTYGLSGEPLGVQFQIAFETDVTYGRIHSFSSVNLIPELDSGWETGQVIRISGTVANSTGYEVKVTIGTGSDMITGTAFVSHDGTWSIEITLPDDAMSGTMILSIGVPGGPSAYSKEYDVEVKAPAEHGPDDAKDDLTMYYVIGAAIILIIAVIIAGSYMKAQRKKADEEMDIEITEVDGDWQDSEE